MVDHRETRKKQGTCQPWNLAFYQAAIDPGGELYLVTFAFGRWGGNAGRRHENARAVDIAEEGEEAASPNLTWAGLAAEELLTPPS